MEKRKLFNGILSIQKLGNISKLLSKVQVFGQLTVLGPDLKIIPSYDDLVQSTNHVKRYILQIDEMLADFTKMEKYLERSMEKCRDLELFFGNRTGTLDINVEGKDPLPVSESDTAGFDPVIKAQ